MVYPHPPPPPSLVAVRPGWWMPGVVWLLIARKFLICWKRHTLLVPPATRVTEPLRWGWESPSKGGRQRKKGDAPMLRGHLSAWLPRSTIEKTPGEGRQWSCQSAIVSVSLQGGYVFQLLLVTSAFLSRLSLFLLIQCVILQVSEEQRSC